MRDNDISMRQLHDKATRGGSLTDAEQARMEAWYGQQDAGENALLAASATLTGSIGKLRSELQTASAQLLTVTEHIQSLIGENEALRREITVLSQQLSSCA